MSTELRDASGAVSSKMRSYILSYDDDESLVSTSTRPRAKQLPTVETTGYYNRTTVPLRSRHSKNDKHSSSVIVTPEKKVVHETREASSSRPSGADEEYQKRVQAEQRRHGTVTMQQQRKQQYAHYDPPSAMEESSSGRGNGSYSQDPDGVPPARGMYEKIAQAKQEHRDRLRKFQSLQQHRYYSSTSATARNSRPAQTSVFQRSQERRNRIKNHNIPPSINAYEFDEDAIMTSSKGGGGLKAGSFSAHERRQRAEEHGSRSGFLNNNIPAHLPAEPSQHPTRRSAVMMEDDDTAQPQALFERLDQLEVNEPEMSIANEQQQHQHVHVRHLLPPQREEGNLSGHRPQRDVLDKVFEPMESILCCRAADHHLVPMNFESAHHQKDLLDNICEPVEACVCGQPYTIEGDVVEAPAPHKMNHHTFKEKFLEKEVLSSGFSIENSIIDLTMEEQRQTDEIVAAGNNKDQLEQEPHQEDLLDFVFTRVERIICRSE